jgi:predicted O-linked N-acetylglucosamine transferase (SPINDLY family)
MADSRLKEADALLGNGKPDLAATILSAILATGGATADDVRAALLLRARAREAQGDPKAAIDDLRSAIVRHPRDARIRNSLGILLADTGDPRGAIEALSIAVELDPGYARAWNNLANALRSGGRIVDAAAAVRRAVALQPDYGLAWSNLGTILLDLGDEAGAREAFQRALALKPDVRTIQALAAIARQLGDLDEAVALYTRAAAATPADANPLLQLAGTLAERDDLDAARRAYAGARSRRPALLRAALGEALTLPMVYEDAAAVEAARGGYAAGIAKLEAEIPALVRGRTFGDVVDDLRWTNFLLAYQGEDDRELQARFAAIVGCAIEAVGPEWRAPPRRTATGKRVRVGFASSFFIDGTCGRYFRNWIAGLDRARFEIFVYHLRREVTPLLEDLRPHADRVRTFAGPALVPSAIAPVIRGDALDALVYPELGMHGPSFALAALRLAPIQCAAWGHPVTTGHATIDAFFTCAAMEPPDAARHYSERLLMLPGIGTDYARPAIPDAAARTRFGLPEGVPLLLCPQSLFKIHPDNDILFARTLAAAPAARLVVFEGRHPALTAKFHARLTKVFAREGLSAVERLIVLPQCGHDDFLRINSVCDAMLDTLRWSGGNTSLDALAVGLPIVTLPGRFMRGRQSAGMLSLAGIDDLVARDSDEFVRIAVRLATDREWRNDQSARIRAAATRFFADPAPVRGFADALEALVRAG